MRRSSHVAPRSKRSFVLPVVLAVTVVTAMHSAAVQAADAGTEDAGRSSTSDAGDPCVEQGGHWESAGCMGEVCAAPDGATIRLGGPETGRRISQAVRTPALFGAGCC